MSRASTGHAAGRYTVSRNERLAGAIGWTFRRAVRCAAAAATTRAGPFGRSGGGGPRPHSICRRDGADP
jgi:hypothetical protein